MSDARDFSVAINPKDYFRGSCRLEKPTTPDYIPIMATVTSTVGAQCGLLLPLSNSLKVYRSSIYGFKLANCPVLDTYRYWTVLNVETIMPSDENKEAFYIQIYNFHQHISVDIAMGTIIAYAIPCISPQFELIDYSEEAEKKLKSKKIKQKS